MLRGSWTFAVFCMRHLPRQGFENPNKSVLRPGSPVTQTGGTQACVKIWAEAKDIRTRCAINVFCSWAWSSLRMLSYGSSHPSYALAAEQVSWIQQCGQHAGRTWALDHLWPCSFSTEVPKYWNWGICTGNLVVQMLHGEPMDQHIGVFFGISSAMSLP